MIHVACYLFLVYTIYRYIHSIPINGYTINRYENDDFQKKSRYRLYLGDLSNKNYKSLRFFFELFFVPIYRYRL